MKFKLFLWQSSDILTILWLEKKHGLTLNVIVENIPWFLTQKIQNPFLIIANYVELINHYALSTGHEGIQCYLYFGVIKVLFRTRISASSSSFGSFCTECVRLILRKYFCAWSAFHHQIYFVFLPKLYRPDFCLSCAFAERQKKRRCGCARNLKLKHPFPSVFRSILLRSFDAKPRSLLWKQQGPKDLLVCQARFRKL